MPGRQTADNHTAKLASVESNMSACVHNDARSYVASNSRHSFDAFRMCVWIRVVTAVCNLRASGLFTTSSVCRTQANQPTAWKPAIKVRVRRAHISGRREKYLNIIKDMDVDRFLVKCKCNKWKGDIVFSVTKVNRSKRSCIRRNINSFIFISHVNGVVNLVFNGIRTKNFYLFCM